MLGTMEQRTAEMKKQAQELIEQAYQRGFKAGYDKAFSTLNENWQLVTSEVEENILDKIRTEIMSKDGLEEALEIIDKYKAESER